MPTANTLVRSIFGFSRCNTQALVRSIEIAYELLFVQGRSRNSIQVTKDIYPDVAREIQPKRYKTVVRQIERLCNQCWDRIRADPYLLEKVIGNHTKELEAPSEIIFLLACYLKYKKPFQEVLEREPALTF